MKVQPENSNLWGTSFNNAWQTYFPDDLDDELRNSKYFELVYTNDPDVEIRERENV
jgi:hypothetical protein